MEYSIKREDKWVAITVRGPINFESSDVLRSVFEKIVAEGTKNVRLNLKMVPVSNSAGISTILILYRNLKNKGGTLEIKGIHKNLFEMLRLLKIDKLIKIEDE